MMLFIADLHIHSRFSRATSPSLDLEHLSLAAQLKGVSVLATGDFTHPRWLEEITEKLVPAEPGLFRLRQDLAGAVQPECPRSCRGETRFMLVTEISCIYQKAGATRKNHNLVFMPDLECARRFITRLSRVGDMRSDGRPILGLDARNLLEMVLDTSTDAFLVPAHIWTPWFSVLGSKSGFDSLEQCFGDLSGHIFAVETGLSSDPAMNRRVSSLDSRTLISNSDAHSTMTLGRNANLLDTDLSYSGIKEAIREGRPPRFRGTLDLFPQQGKYHLDGHRKCRFRCHPRRTAELGGLCPHCAKSLTLGVLNRVETLADRGDNELPAGMTPCHHIIPLVEILSELFGVGTRSRTVQRECLRLLEVLGPELDILLNADPARIRTAGLPRLDEAIGGMRSGKVNISPGYDGKFGAVRLFADGD